VVRCAVEEVWKEQNRAGRSRARTPLLWRALILQDCKGVEQADEGGNGGRLIFCTVQGHPNACPRGAVADDAADPDALHMPELLACLIGQGTVTEPPGEPHRRERTQSSYSAQVLAGAILGKAFPTWHWGTRLPQGTAGSNNASLPLVSGSQETWKTPDRLGPGSFHVPVTLVGDRLRRSPPRRHMEE
jgi:hypothetical protein